MQARKGYGAAMKKDTIDKLIDRIDHIKEEDLQRFFVKLAEQQGFFQQVFESIQEGLILLDSKGKISCSSTRRRSSSSTRSPNTSRRRTSASSWAATAPGTRSSKAIPPFPGMWKSSTRSTNS